MIKNTIFIFCYCLTLVVDAQQVPRHLSDLYNKLYTSMSNGNIIKPTLKIIDDLGESKCYKEVATYSPTNKTISIGTSFLKLTSQFGKDSSNARAHVLSHELAHLFLNHGFASIIGTGFASIEINKELKKSKAVLEEKMSELEADQWAHFYAYIAGYHTNDVAPKLLDSIYKYYDLSDKKLSKYPKLYERKKFANDATIKMKSMCEVFDFANMACIHENFELAEELYNTIIQEGFKSREIISNLGTIYLLQAIRLMDTSETKFILPLQIDMETRMRQVNKRATVNNNDNINELLNKAIELFHQSIIIDKEYSTAYLNLSIAYWLHKQFKDSDYFLEKSKDFSDAKTLSKIGVFEALKLIHLHDSQKKSEGLKLLNGLANEGNILAKANLNFNTNGKSDISKIPDWILKLDKEKLPINFQNAINILDSTFSKDKFHILSCKEVNNPFKYRKWKLLNEKSFIVLQYIFNNDINKTLSDSEKIDLFAVSQAVIETANACYLRFNDIILILENNNTIKYQILKNN